MGIGLQAEPRSKEATGLGRCLIWSEQEDTGIGGPAKYCKHSWSFHSQWPAAEGGNEDKARGPCGPEVVCAFHKVPSQLTGEDRTGFQPEKISCVHLSKIIAGSVRRGTGM